MVIWVEVRDGKEESVVHGLESSIPPPLERITIGLSLATTVLSVMMRPGSIS